MIDFHFELNFSLEESKKHVDWITRVVEEEGFELGKLDYIFCDDEKLISINQQYLGHNTYTDIITFDYTETKTLSGDIFISIERVRENSLTFNTTFEKELLRVMIHGVLHLIGYGDKDDSEVRIMREKEEEKIKMFHVEQ